MGRTRSGEEAARKLGKSAQLIARWSVKWNWVERAAEWGDEQDRQNRIAQTDAVEKMNERHANLAAAMTVKVLEKLKAMGAQDIKEMTPATMPKSADAMAARDRRV